MSWDEDPVDAPGQTEVYYAYFHPSQVYNRGSSNSVVLATLEWKANSKAPSGLTISGMKLYSHKPAAGNGFESCQTITSHLTHRRKIDGILMSGAEREFIESVTVGADMYVLAKDEQHTVDTVVRVKLGPDEE
ncbi:hypothetical protein VKT23_016331 [Stygiomarasmius scandens]|uniref:Uncharacterized protein n=1 Tax=Marasmiellus scandens TaxID=2682957 RepID=A0ABR1IYM8_9AGAR